MTIPETGAEAAATRHLIGLSAIQLATALDVKRATINDWERERFTPSIGLREDLADLRERHDRALAALIDYHDNDGGIIALPAAPMPAGWYRALGARLLDHRPNAMLAWEPRGEARDG